MSEPKLQLERVQGTPVSSDEILSDIRSLARQADTKIVLQRLHSKLGECDPATASRRFGTWNKAVIAAGPEVADEIDISDERSFENMTLLREHFGRQLRRAGPAHPPSLIFQQPYNRRFRSWSEALTQFVEFANAREMQPPSLKAATGHRTAHDPSLRLRFRAMKRDNFSRRA